MLAMENLEKVINLIRENTDCKGEILPGDNLVNDLYLDSLDKLLILNAVEDVFSIILEGEDLRGLDTVADIAERLNKLQTV